MSTETSSKHQLHVLPVSTYLGVGAALLVLTGITVWVAQFHFGEWNLIVAMAVAVTKAILVALIFMHLLWDNKVYMVIFLSSILFLGIFIVLTMFDTLRRDDIYDYVDKPINPNAIIYQIDSTKTPAASDSTAVPPGPAH
ncbi:cytochrome C oxidase subunit IV family protein [bacterium]|nr:cytochrome C oxidase subunit IV family protein [bacterium]